MKQIVGKVLKKIENVFKIKNSKMSKRQLKLIIPAAVCLFVFVVAIGGRVIFSSLTANIYSISDLNGNIDNIKVGDTLVYEINGNYSWKIIDIDKENGTVDVVSNSDLDEITFEPGKSSSYYSEILQSSAEKYNDYKYVLSSRCIELSDLSKFEYNSDFWLGDIDNEKIISSTDTWNYNSSVDSETKGFRPVITLNLNLDEKKLNLEGLNIGDYVKFGVNGYNNWRVLSINEENKTIDIVSAGVVKNITLNGSNDYENYESIIQNEINKYSSKDVINVRNVSLSDLVALKQMGDKNRSAFFYDEKNEIDGRTYTTSSTYKSATLKVQYVYTVSFDSPSNEFVNKQNILAVILVGDKEAVDYFTYNARSRASYEANGKKYEPGPYRITSGLRPILTLKLDDIEEIVDNNEIDTIENELSNNDKAVYNEQIYNNQNISANNEKSNSSITYSNSGNRNNYIYGSDNNSEIANNYNNELKNNNSNMYEKCDSNIKKGINIISLPCFIVIIIIFFVFLILTTSYLFSKSIRLLKK